MSLTPSFGDKIAKQLVALYAKGEEHLLTFLAKTLAGERGHGANWLARMTLKIGPVRIRVQKILDKLQGDSRAMVTEAIREAWERGRQAAIDDIPGVTVPVYNIDGAAAEQAESVTRKLEEARPRAELAATNRYREIIDEVTRDQRADSEAARKRLVQAALDKFAADGITAFVDKNGRRYDLVSYTEMAVRAAITEAEVESYTRQLVHAGIDLVIVSDVPQACGQCTPFEGKILSITGATRAAIWTDADTGETKKVPVYASVPEAKARGLWHPGCVLPDTKVITSGGLVSSDSRWYDGEIIVINTAGGHELSITPNHPVLTTEGWVPAGELEVGHRVVRSGLNVERVVPSSPDDEAVEPSISDIHHALRESLSVAPERVPASPEQFHGDGGHSDVEIVRADSLLLDSIDASFSDGVSDFGFLVGGYRQRLLLSEGLRDALLLRRMASLSSGMSCGVLSRTLLCGHGSPLASLSFTPAYLSASGDDFPADISLGGVEGFSEFSLTLAGTVSLNHSLDPALSTESGVASLLGLDSVFLEDSVDRSGTDSNGGRDLAGALTREVAADDIVSVERKRYVGQVFNLETGSGWYDANSIVVHNCRHTLEAWTPKDPFPPQADTPDPQGYRDSQRLRALERRVRKWKRVRSVATDRESELKADRRIALAQRDIREHVARTGVRRQRDREQLHRGYTGTPDAIALDAERRARERKSVDDLVEEIRQEQSDPEP